MEIHTHRLATAAMTSRHPLPAALTCLLAFAACLNPCRSKAAEPDEAARTKSVRVVDEAGEPIIGARVIAWAIRTQRAHGGWTPNGYGQGEPPERTTDAEGRATLPAPLFADRDQRENVIAITCRVAHPDFVESVYNDVNVTPAALPEEATVVLYPGDLLEVAGQSEAGPLPIERVFAQWSSDSYFGREGTTITEEGMRRLPRLPPGPELLRLVYLPKEGEALFSHVDPLQLTNGKRRRIRALLFPGVRVTGRLDDSVPRPVANGRVVAQVIDYLKDDGPASDETLQWRAVAKISEDGTFTLPAMPPGHVQIIAICDGFLAAPGEPPAFLDDAQRARAARTFGSPQVFEVAPRGEHADITIEMTPAASCEFHFSDPEGRPLAGIGIGFSPNVRWWLGGSQIYCWPFKGAAEMLDPPADAEPLDFRDQPFAVETDADGRAVIKTLPAGQGVFRAGNDDWELWADETHTQSGRADLNPGKRTVMNLTMQPRSTPSP